MKTTELEGGQLDFWVAKAEGYKAELTEFEEPDPEGRMAVVDITGHAWALHPWTVDIFAPSTNWAQGGPIIERERIAIEFYGTYWGAMPKDKNNCEVPDLNPDRHAEMSDGWCPIMAVGPTPLIAAMRAYIASKYGDTVPC